PARGDGVNAEAWEAVVVAVTLHLADIDVVVSEGAHVEWRQGIVRTSTCRADGRVEPDRGMLDRQRPADVEAGPHLRKGLAVGVVVAHVGHSPYALLIVEGP